MKKITTENSRIELGWREWLALPQLGIPAIKAKIDTGARTSALHTFNLEKFYNRGVLKVRFGVHPLQRSLTKELFCVAEIVDQRIVSDSGGHRENRIVIQTPMLLGGRIWPIEITLTNREDMRFRMLLGREALKDNVVIYSGKSYLTGKGLSKYYKK